MKLSELTLFIIMVALCKDQLAEWALNRQDAIALTDKAIASASMWQCGALKQQMADLSEHAAASPFQYRGEHLNDLDNYLALEWKQEKCEQLLGSEGY